MSAEHSQLLLDTHVVVWMATEPERLPIALRSAIEGAERRYVSLVTAWEIQVKHGKHRASFPFGLRHLEETMKAFSCRQLAVEYDDIRRMDTMLFLHSDPFDRLLMAQAALRPVYLATLDENIAKTYERSKEFCLFSDRPRGMGLGE